MVVLVDFLDPALEERLEAYAALNNVVAVREHLGWDAGNALRRFAKRPDLLTDPAWRKGLGALRRFGFRCGLEVFAPQLSRSARRRPPASGYRLHARRHGLAAGSEPGGLRAVAARLGGVEPLRERPRRDRGDRMHLRHGLAPGANRALGPLPHRDVRPRALHVRQPHADRRPVLGFERLYDAYQEIVAGFSQTERDDLFRGTAAAWFGLH